LKIVALTANAMPEDKAKCIEAGANDYMAKPMRIGAVVEMLEKYLPETKAVKVA